MFSEKPEVISLTPWKLHISRQWTGSLELAPIWHLANLLLTVPAKTPCIVSGERLTAAEIQLIPLDLFHLLKYTGDR